MRRQYSDDDDDRDEPAEQAWQQAKGQLSERQKWTTEWEKRAAQIEERRLASFNARPCKSCGQSFVPGIGHVLRCPECCRRTNELLGRPPAKIDTKPCAICGSTFTGPAQWRRCNACRKANRTLAAARRDPGPHIFVARFQWTDQVVQRVISSVRQMVRSRENQSLWASIARGMATDADLHGVSGSELRILAAHLDHGEIGGTP